MKAEEFRKLLSQMGFEHKFANDSYICETWHNYDLDMWCFFADKPHTYTYSDRVYVGQGDVNLSKFLENIYECGVKDGRSTYEPVRR